MYNDPYRSIIGGKHPDALGSPGSEVWLSPALSPGRKLPYTLELVDAGGLVGVNTGWPNALAEEAIRAQRIPELAGYETIRREVPYGKNSRIDLLLEGRGRSSRPGYRAC